jgi:predicted house-cleaning NTP pyrophosphatase (Maf/HAM1 superfamily)
MDMEQFSPFEKTPAERQVETWKHGHTILASSSEFRKERLEEVGFTDVETVENIPESVETELANDMERNSGAPKTHWDSDGRHFSEHIAAAKVRHILDTENVDGDILVVGFDTTAVVYDQATEEQMMGVPISAEKYKTILETKESILSRFVTLFDGIKTQQAKLTRFLEIQKSIGSSDEDIKTAMEGHGAGIRLGNIYINTGVAVAFPNNHESISRFSKETRLFSHSIAETDGTTQALEKLVDLVIKSQGEEKTLSISGGIDYADSYVRDILKIEEFIPFGKPVEDEDLYRGFASKALQVILHNHAEESLQSEAA